MLALMQKRLPTLEHLMTKEKYLGRGIHKQKFLNSLTTGKLKPMLDAINHDTELDIQIRNNYLNIYFDGGNIAKVSSENSVSFDKNYFYTEKAIPTKEIDDETKDLLKQKRKELINKFKQGNFSEYFQEAKSVMKKWFSANPKPEREEQHQLAIQNRYGNSHYTIIDIEYQVSTESEFYCKFTPEGKDKPKKPRFDIIAVDRYGKLCVIELKKGTGALGSTSGLKEHFECYRLSIGRNHKPFMNEMKKLLAQKQSFGLIDKHLEIVSDRPEFMFAYSFATDDQEKEKSTFQKYYDELPEKPHKIWLKKGSWALKDKQA
jgi:hypothetical protein